MSANTTLTTTNAAATSVTNAAATSVTNAAATSVTSAVATVAVISSGTTSTVVTTSIATTSSSSTLAVASTTSSVAALTPTVAASTSIVYTPTSTVYVPPSSTSYAPTVVSTIESTVTENPATTVGSSTQNIVTIISTQAPTTVTPSITSSATRSSSSSGSASASALSASNSGSSASGLGTSAKIAIAVIIPVVVVALGFLLGMFFWRRRKARKNVEELRKNEMAEYGFNPNNDPNLAVVGAAAAYTDGASEAADDAGYRGWGTTSSAARKPSTTLDSNSKGPAAMALSDSGSQPGGYGYQNAPSNGASEHYSNDPLLNGHGEGQDGIGALGGAAALGGVAAAASRNHRNSNADIQRGVSNASSSYSRGAPHSESSGDTPFPGPYTQEEAPYNIYNDASPAHGPYGEPGYGGDNQPVIRDVQAKRNTRIERAPTFPHTQGGIAQNF